MNGVTFGKTAILIRFFNRIASFLQTVARVNQNTRFGVLQDFCCYSEKKKGQAQTPGQKPPKEDVQQTEENEIKPAARVRF